MDDEDDSSEFEEKPARKPKKGKGKKPRAPKVTAEETPERTWLGWATRWAVSLAFIGGTGFAIAPMAVGWMGLTGNVVSQFALPPGMSLSVGSANLAWWSVIDVEKAHLITADGELDVHLDRLTTSRTLWGLLTSPSDLGTIRIIAPKVLAKVPQFDAPEEPTHEHHQPFDDARIVSRFKSRKVRLEVEQGSVVVEDVAGTKWQLDDVAAEVLMPSEKNHAVEAAFTGKIAPGSSDVRATAQVDTDPATGKVAIVHSKLQASEFPLELINPVLVWAGDHARLGGKLSGNAELTYERAGNSLAIKTDGQVKNLVAVSQFIEPDRLELTALESHVTAKMDAKGIVLTEGRLDCDLGQASGSGAFHWSDKDATDSTLAVQGTIDLPTLVRKLPHLVHVRQDVQIEAGKIALSLKPSPQTAGRLEMKAEVSDLAAKCQGQPIQWPKPVLVDATAGKTAAGELIADFQCSSDFLKAKGSGTVSNFDVTAVCDLNRLQERMGQLLDLGDTRVAGRFTVRVQSTKTEADGITVLGAARAEGLDIRLVGQSHLVEPLLNAQFQARATEPKLTAIETAAIVLKTDREHLTAHLRSPVVDLTNGPWGVWDVQASGDLAEIVRRAKPWVAGLEGWQAGGIGVLSGHFQPSRDQVSFEKFTIDIQDFILAGGNLRIADKRWQFATTGKIDSENLAVVLGPTSLTAEAIQFKTESLKGKVTDEGLAFACQADVTADLARVRAWTLADPAQGDIAGMMKGTGSLESNGRRWMTTMNATIENARLGPTGSPYIDEPSMTIEGQAGADFGSDSLVLKNAKASVSGLVVTASGEVNELATSKTVKLDGLIDYDLQTLGPRLRGLLGDQIILSGRDRRAFRVNGSLASGPADTQFAADQSTAASGSKVAKGEFPGLKGEFSFGWEKANIYGFAAGNANIDGKLADSWVVTKPVSFSLNGGTADLRPGLFLGTQAIYLQHPAGMIAQNVKLTREMCDGAIQYIAPVLAQAVNVEGLVSLQINETEIPLGHLDKAKISGSLFLKDVAATGSPLMQELFVITEGKATLEIAKDTEVKFRVENGRVYHENLRVQLPGMLVTTSGSVGFDRTLAITAEMPLPPNVLKNKVVADYIATQTIRVPIGGTLDKPKIDRDAVNREIAQLVSKSATKSVEKEINKQIDKGLNGLLDKLK